MEFFGIALIVLIEVILIIALYYLRTTTKHKERMMFIEKGLDPNDYQENGVPENTMKYGLLLFGCGLGFLSALLVDEMLIPKIDNPAIYPGMILVFGGLSLIIFYLNYGKKIKEKS